VSMAVDKRIATVAYVCAVRPVHCCLLAGTAEGSIVFTRLRQCAHPTSTLFLEPP